jgi:hypothetical protein
METIMHIREMMRERNWRYMGDFWGMLMGGEEGLRILTRPKKHIRFELTYFIFCHHITSVPLKF